MKHNSVLHFTGLLLLLITGTIRAQTVPIDMTSRTFYVKQGFYLEETTQFPVGEGWKKTVTAGYDRALMGDVLFDFDQRDDSLYQYMLITTIHVDSHVALRRALALSIPRIGTHWELYLNGKLVESCFFIGPDGSRIESLQRNVIVEFPDYLLNDGFNVICFRIAGTKMSRSTGILLGSFPFSVDSLERLNSLKIRDFLPNLMFFIGGAVVFLIMLFFIFVIPAKIHKSSGRAGRREVYVALLMVGISLLLQLANSHLLYQLIGNSRFDMQLLRLCSVSIPLLMIPLFAIRLQYKYILWVILYTLVGLLFCGSMIGFTVYSDRVVATMLLLVMVFSLLINAPAVRNSLQSLKMETFFERIFPFSILFNHNIQSLTLYFVSFAVVIYMVVRGNMVTPSIVLTYLTAVGVIISTIRVLRREMFIRKRDHGRTNSLFKEIKDIDMELVSARKNCDETKDENVTLISKINVMEENNRTDSQVLGVVQSYIFPRRVPDTDNYEAAFITEKQSEVSGDMYDFYTEGRSLLGVSLFETTSHGLAPGLVTILMRSIIYRRFVQLWDHKLSVLFEKIQKDLSTELGGMNIFLAGKILKFDANRVEYVNAGHTDILFRSSHNGLVRLVAPSDRSFKSQKLGGKSGINEFNMLSFSVKPGDMFLLFTDGYERCHNRASIKYGLPRIMETLENIPDQRDLTEVLDYLVKNLNNHRDSAPLEDDYTLILIRKL
ncbi:MAG: SpoIIE family protein phosphatase [Spirochaetes bacterium]|nr:SpoIIE family protein phosphatase [Spirochaetota bacterium]